MNVNIESNEYEESPNDNDPMIMMEDALKLCKFGKFHIKLLFASFCATIATVTVTTTSSFILPIAECDLGMDMLLKGWLNSMPFLGQMGASVFIGFLVDTFGRRIFLLTGNFGIFLCALLEGSSQTYWMLVVVKMLQGVAMSLSFTAISTMLSEFIHKEIRDRTLLLLGAFMSLSIVIVALMSWAILPQTQLHFVVWKGYFEIHSWNIYLYVCSIWSLLAFILYYMLPESPKFLLSAGYKEKALKVLKLIYQENTGKDQSTFPIKALKCGITTNKTDKKLNLKKQIVKSMFEVKHLFDKVIVYRLILLCSMTFVCLSTLATCLQAFWCCGCLWAAVITYHHVSHLLVCPLFYKKPDLDLITWTYVNFVLLPYTCLRLWYPQISTTVEHYYKDHGHSSQFCEMINYRSIPNISVSIEITSSNICIPQVSGSETYVNSILIGVTSLIFVGLASLLVNLMGHRLLIFIVQLSCAACAIGLYFTNSSIQIAILISAICAFMQANGSLQSNILVRIFPTKLRALTFSIVMIVGRLGSLLGNVLFPVLLDLGCMAPFLTLSVASLCQASVVYFLPDPNKENKTGDK